MKNVYGCAICSLRVRVSNRAAISLYERVLGYEIAGVEKAYYADGEDANDMKKYFTTDSKATEEKKSQEVAEESKTAVTDEKGEELVDEKSILAPSAGEGKNAERNRKKREKAKAKKAAQKQ